MYRALLVCSEDECPEVYEAYGALEDLEALACECGCGLEVLGWAEPLDGAQDGSPVAGHDVALEPVGGGG